MEGADVLDCQDPPDDGCPFLVLYSRPLHAAWFCSIQSGTDLGFVPFGQHPTQSWELVCGAICATKHVRRLTFCLTVTNRCCAATPRSYPPCAATARRFPARPSGMAWHWRLRGNEARQICMKTRQLGAEASWSHWENLRPRSCKRRVAPRRLERTKDCGAPGASRCPVTAAHTWSWATPHSGSPLAMTFRCGGHLGDCMMHGSMFHIISTFVCCKSSKSPFKSSHADDAFTGMDT